MNRLATTGRIKSNHEVFCHIDFLLSVLRYVNTRPLEIIDDRMATILCLFRLLCFAGASQNLFILFDDHVF
jgi:hypothetical protein